MVEFIIVVIFTYLQEVTRDPFPDAPPSAQRNCAFEMELLDDGQLLLDRVVVPRERWQAVIDDIAQQSGCITLFVSPKIRTGTVIELKGMIDRTDNIRGRPQEFVLRFEPELD